MVGKSLPERLDARGICRRPLHENAGDGPDELDERSKYTLQFLLGKATPNVAAVVLRRRPGRWGSPGRQHALHFVSESLAFCPSEIAKASSAQSSSAERLRPSATRKITGAIGPK